MSVVATSVHPGRVVAVAALTPLMRRVEIVAPTLPAASVLQDVAVVLPDPADPGRTVRRRYTVRDADPTAGTLALEAVLHGHGPGARWAGDVGPGDAVALYGPRGGLDAGGLPRAARHLVLADDAGLPGVRELLPHLAATPATAVTAVVEVAGPEEEQPVGGIGWVHRGSGRPTGSDADLLAAVAAFAPGPDDAVTVLAESRVVAAVRARVLAAGVPRAHLHAKGYWNRTDPRRARSQP